MTNGDWVRNLDNKKLAKFIVKMMKVVEKKKFNETNVYLHLVSVLDKERDERWNDYSGLDV